MTILPRLVNISPQKVMFTPKYVDLRALSSVVASRIYALFVVKSTRVPRLGGGGQANLGNARIFTASVTATPPFLKNDIYEVGSAPHLVAVGNGHSVARLSGCPCSDALVVSWSRRVTAQRGMKMSAGLLSLPGNRASFLPFFIVNI